MLKIGDAFRVSACDLVGHLNCRNLTELDLAVAKGSLAKPKSWADPLLDVLRERGIRHEEAYVDHLREEGRTVQTIPGVGFETDAVAATAQTMSQGGSSDRPRGVSERQLGRSR
jgi:hypothetical protein